MDFEFDPAKSASNLDKHGIDFEEAQRIWLDRNRLEVASPSLNETRQAVIGMVGAKCWTAIVTYREGRIRLISVRRAREVEVVCYEG